MNAKLAKFIRKCAGNQDQEQTTYVQKKGRSQKGHLFPLQLNPEDPRAKYQLMKDYWLKAKANGEKPSIPAAKKAYAAKTYNLTDDHQDEGNT